MPRHSPVQYAMVPHGTIQRGEADAADDYGPTGHSGIMAKEGTMTRSACAVHIN